eukprot:scaffold1311_cov256-Pinguiococcus_pyrenoidosus.AAC.80
MKLLSAFAAKGTGAQFCLGAIYVLFGQKRFKKFYKPAVSNALADDEDEEEDLAELAEELREEHSPESVKYSRLQEVVVVLEEALQRILASEQGKALYDNLESQMRSEMDYFLFITNLFISYGQGKAKPYLSALPIVAAIFAAEGKPNLT